MCLHQLYVARASAQIIIHPVVAAREEFRQPRNKLDHADDEQQVHNLCRGIRRNFSFGGSRETLALGAGRFTFMGRSSQVLSH